MKRWILSAFVCVVLVNMAGCGTFKRNFADDTKPAERELVYDRALDYTYQVVLDAVNETGTWNLYETDKTAGKIRVFDSRYKELFNPDDRVVTIFVKPLARRKTVVSLAKDSISKFRAAEVLDAIEARMSRIDQITAPVAPQKV